MNRSDRNWKNLCNHYIRDWHGTWTRYSPQGEVTESFQSLRSYRSNPERTILTQTNRYTYPDGRTEEKSWPLDRNENSLEDGLWHPFFPALRSLFFEGGYGASVTTQVNPNSTFGGELFFIEGDVRHSIPFLYDPSGNLMKTSCIREDANGFPSKYWSSDIDLVSDRDLSGNWQGTSETMTPDLEVSPPAPTQFHWGWEGNKTFFFPDGISLSCPEKITLGTPLTIAGNWLLAPDRMQQLLVEYDELGAFYRLILQQFHK